MFSYVSFLTLCFRIKVKALVVGQLDRSVMFGPGQLHEWTVTHICVGVMTELLYYYTVGPNSYIATSDRHLKSSAV